MQKASIGTVMISLLIGNSPAEGNEGKIINELLKIYSETPNPSEEDLHKFLTRIKEMESIVIASEFRSATGRGSTVRVVTEQKNEETKHKKEKTRSKSREKEEEGKKEVEREIHTLGKLLGG